MTRRKLDRPIVADGKHGVVGYGPEATDGQPFGGLVDDVGDEGLRGGQRGERDGRGGDRVAMQA